MIEIGYITKDGTEVVDSSVNGAPAANAEVEALRQRESGREDIYTFFMQIRMSDSVRKFAFVDPA